MRKKANLWREKSAARAAAMLLVLALIAETSRADAATEPAPRPPNVVLIISDDQGWGDFGFMGHEHVRTPHLDKLAGQSAVFPNGYVPTSLCRASLATIITGRYAHEHRICCNDPPKGVDRSAMLPFMRDAPALPRLLGTQLGYRSLQTGKWWEGHWSNGGFTHGMSENKQGGRHGDVGLEIGRKTMRPVFDFIDESRKDATPFLVWYAPMMPHEPHNPPQRLLDKYLAPGRSERMARYWAMCEWFDETCGQLLDFLDERQLADDTLVLFVIDNGWIQEGGPRRSRLGGATARSKRSPYDGGVRTPVLVRWPGRVKPGRYNDLVSTIDVSPTILAACGAKPPPDLPGLNLLPRAAGGEPLAREAVFGEIFTHDAVKLDEPALSLKHRWVRKGGWKLIRPVDGPPELYHVATDPAEGKNLAGEQPERVGHLTTVLDQWWNGTSGGGAAGRKE